MQVKVPYDEANNRKFPEQVAVIIAKDEKGKYNPITVGWVMPVSMKPPMWAFCLGAEQYSLGAIRHAKEFVISLPSSKMAPDAAFFGTRSGRDMDKLQRFGSKIEKASKVDSVLLSEAVANFECVLEDEHITGDCVTIVGKVVASHMNPDTSVGRLFVLDSDLTLGGVVPG